LNRFLIAVFEGGASRSNMDLIRPIYRQLIGATLLPTFQAARISGELREGIDDDELSEWLMRDVLMLLADAPLEEPQLRRRIRQFLLPVMIPEAALLPAEAMTSIHSDALLLQQLRQVELKMAELQVLVASMRRALSAQPAPRPRRAKP
jgi:hypothetical protein